jgi:hypothetical protein
MPGRVSRAIQRTEAEGMRHPTIALFDRWTRPLDPVPRARHRGSRVRWGPFRCLPPAAVKRSARTTGNVSRLNHEGLPIAGTNQDTVDHLAGVVEAFPRCARRSGRLRHRRDSRAPSAADDWKSAGLPTRRPTRPSARQPLIDPRPPGAERRTHHHTAQPTSVAVLPAVVSQALARSVDARVTSPSPRRPVRPPSPHSTRPGRRNLRRSITPTTAADRRSRRRPAPPEAPLWKDHR